jgi:hypothetical protein
MTFNLFLTFISLLFISLGGVLDFLNIIFGYLTAYKKRHVSGLLLVPLIFYVLGIYLSEIKFIIEFRGYIILLLTVIHLFVYGILPILFEKLLNSRTPINTPVK